MCNVHCEIKSMIVKYFPLAGEKAQRFLAWGPKAAEGSKMSGSKFHSPQEVCSQVWR